MIKEFFVNNKPGPDFSIFGLNHIIVLIIFFSFIGFLIYKRNKISNLKESTKRKVLITVVTIMAISQITYFATRIGYGIFDYKIHLPLHLCFISNYIFIYAIFFNKQKLLKLTYFLSFIGPIPAILWPELTSCFDNFEFYEYLTSHYIFLSASVFNYFAYNYKIEKIDFIKVAVLINGLIFAMLPFNIAFDMNYIFSTEIPQIVIDVYPFLEHLNPLLVIEITGLTIAFIIYKLAQIRSKELEKK